MKVIEQFGWVYYLNENGARLDEHKCGKWMYFFGDIEFAAKVCQEAVETDIVAEAKHSDSSEGVCCFYLNGDDLASHKRVIQFFLENGLIQRTKTGRLYNISFKYDDQTQAGQYGKHYYPEIKLDQFIDLATVEWKV